MRTILLQILFKKGGTLSHEIISQDPEFPYSTEKEELYLTI